MGARFWADQLTLSQPGGQIMPTTLLLAPPLPYDIFRPSYGPVWPGVGTYEQCVPPCPVHTFTEWERELFSKKSKMNRMAKKH